MIKVTKLLQITKFVLNFFKVFILNSMPFFKKFLVYIKTNNYIFTLNIIRKRK